MESKELKRYEHPDDNYFETPDGEWVKFSDIAHLLTPQGDEGFDEEAAFEKWSVTSGVGQNSKPFIEGARYMFHQLRKGPR